MRFFCRIFQCRSRVEDMSFHGYSESWCLSTVLKSSQSCSLRPGDGGALHIAGHPRQEVEGPAACNREAVWGSSHERRESGTGKGRHAARARGQGEQVHPAPTGNHPRKRCETLDGSRCRVLRTVHVNVGGARSDSGQIVTFAVRCPKVCYEISACSQEVTWTVEAETDLGSSAVLV